MAASLCTHSGPEHGLCVGGGRSQEQSEAADAVGCTGPGEPGLDATTTGTWCLALGNGFRHVQAPAGPCPTSYHPEEKPVKNIPEGSPPLPLGRGMSYQLNGVKGQPGGTCPMVLPAGPRVRGSCGPEMIHSYRGCCGVCSAPVMSVAEP